MSKRSSGQIKAREEARKEKMAARRAEKKERAEAHRTAGMSHAAFGGRNQYRKAAISGLAIVRTRVHPQNCGNMACKKCQPLLTPGQPFHPVPSTYSPKYMDVYKSYNPTTGKYTELPLLRSESAQARRYSRGEIVNDDARNLHLTRWPENWGRSNKELERADRA